MLTTRLSGQEMSPPSAARQRTDVERLIKAGSGDEALKRLVSPLVSSSAAPIAAPCITTAVNTRAAPRVTAERPR